MPKPIYIHAAAALGPCGDFEAAQRAVLRVDPPQQALKPLVKKIIGHDLRQASHFVELAALASQICIQRLPFALPRDTAVYLGTGLAEVQKTFALFQQTIENPLGLASPFDFVSSANNMAAFYVAKLAQVAARNLTITQEGFSFERALQLAYFDLTHGAVAQALVGGVDENSFPRAEHLRHIPLRADQIMGEGSAWFYLNREALNARGEVIAIAPLARTQPWADLRALLARYRAPSEPLRWLPGMGLGATDVAAIATALQDCGAAREDYLSYCGCYYTAAAFGLACMFDRTYTRPALFVHMNRDERGELLCALVRALR